MTTIEYGEKRIEVPDCWDDITLGKYETVSAMPAKTAKEKVEMMAEICGVEVSVLLDWPAEIFNRMVEITEFLFREEEKVEPAASIEIDGVQYAVPIGDKITLGVWVDVDEVQKIGQNVLSGVLAIVCRPVGEEYDGNNNEVRQRLFAALPVSRVMPVLAFFLHCKNVSERRTEVFSLLSRGIDRLARSTGNSQRCGDGIKLLRIWRRGVSWILIGLLRSRWKRLLRSCSSDAIKTSRKKRSEN